MNAQLPCLLLDDPPSAGDWNMAVDQLLLAQAADTGQAALRFYRWREPTLSLGYFQRFAECSAQFAGDLPAVVRRQTGGGAILHDHELTYSLVLPPAHPNAANSQSVYDKAHCALAEVLKQFLPPAHAVQLCAQKSTDQPFLCFERRAIGDIVYRADQQGQRAGPKIVGSAQRRSNKALLQHGSILLKASPRAGHLLGLRDLADGALDQTRLQESIGAAFAAQFHLQFEADSPPSALQWSSKHSAEIEHLLSTRYANGSWTQRR